MSTTPSESFEVLLSTALRSCSYFNLNGEFDVTWRIREGRVIVEGQSDTEMYEFDDQKITVDRYGDSTVMAIGRKDSQIFSFLMTRPMTLTDIAVARLTI